MERFYSLVCNRVIIGNNARVFTDYHQGSLIIINHDYPSRVKKGMDKLPLTPIRDLLSRKEKEECLLLNEAGRVYTTYHYYSKGLWIVLKLPPIRGISVSSTNALATTETGLIYGRGENKSSQIAERWRFSDTGHYWLRLEKGLYINSRLRSIEYCRSYTIPSYSLTRSEAKIPVRKALAGKGYWVSLDNNGYIYLSGETEVVSKGRLCSTLPYKNMLACNPQAPVWCLPLLKDIAVREEHILALTLDHKLLVIGNNDRGQLGNKIKRSRQWRYSSVPQSKLVKTSESCSALITTKGEVYYTPLGTPTEEDLIYGAVEETWTKIEGVEAVSDLVIGENELFFVHDDGSLSSYDLDN